MPPERDALWRVYSRYFDAERDRFEAAVDVAGEVLRFFDGAGGGLVGMSLVSSFDEEHEGRRFRVVTTSGRTGGGSGRASRRSAIRCRRRPT